MAEVLGSVGTSPSPTDGNGAVAPSKERPILFSAPMVRAILDDRKTHTRRIVKPQPPAGLDRHCWYYAPLYGWTDQPSPARDWHTARCPYGAPGDRLWVRETFSGLWEYDEAKLSPNGWYETDPVWYWADGNPTEGDWTRPKPSIHMPRWASRITLEITGIRVERLQDISDDDAEAEGIREPSLGEYVDFGWIMAPRASTPAKTCFANLWMTINGVKSWGENPWVWVVSFRRLAEQARAA